MTGASRMLSTFQLLHRYALGVPREQRFWGCLGKAVVLEILTIYGRLSELSMTGNEVLASGACWSRPSCSSGLCTCQVLQQASLHSICCSLACWLSFDIVYSIFTS